MCASSCLLARLQQSDIARRSRKMLPTCGKPRTRRTFLFLGWIGRKIAPFSCAHFQISDSDLRIPGPCLQNLLVTPPWVRVSSPPHPPFLSYVRFPWPLRLSHSRIRHGQTISIRLYFKLKVASRAEQEAHKRGSFHYTGGDRFVRLRRTCLEGLSSFLRAERLSHQEWSKVIQLHPSLPLNKRTTQKTLQQLLERSSTACYFSHMKSLPTLSDCNGVRLESNLRTRHHHSLAYKFNNASLRGTCL